MPRVVRMASQNCKCPVELLGHHQPCVRMGQRHWTQRQQQLRSCARHIRPATGRAYGKNNVLGAFIAPHAKPPRKLLRTHRPPAPVQQRRHCRRSPLLPIQPLNHRLFGAESLRMATRKRRTPLKVGLNHRVKLVLRSRSGCNMSQRYLHGEEHISTGMPRPVAKQEFWCQIWNISRRIYSFSYLPEFNQRMSHELKTLVSIRRVFSSRSLKIGPCRAAVFTAIRVICRNSTS
jgi:hypothetical protein